MDEEKWAVSQRPGRKNKFIGVMSPFYHFPPTCQFLFSVNIYFFQLKVFNSEDYVFPFLTKPVS